MNIGLTSHLNNSNASPTGTRTSDPEDSYEDSFESEPEEEVPTGLETARATAQSLVHDVVKAEQQVVAAGFVEIKKELDDLPQILMAQTAWVLTASIFKS